MATTALFVEILIIGALAELWLATALLAIAPPVSTENIVATSALVKDAIPILAAPALALTYAIGWVVNFLGERLFKRFFERSLQDSLFEAGANDYYKARDHFQETHREGNRLSRHIMRVARSNVLNFTLLGMAIPFHWRSVNHRILIAVVGISFAIALISLVQWRKRYEDYNEQVQKAWDDAHKGRA